MIPLILGGVAVTIVGSKKVYSYLKKRFEEEAEQRAREEAERKAEKERLDAEYETKRKRILAEAKAKAERKEREEKEAIRDEVVHEKYNSTAIPTDISTEESVKIEADIQYEVDKRYQIIQEKRAREKELNNLMESIRAEVQESREESANLAKNLSAQLEEAQEDLRATKQMVEDLESKLR